MFIRVGGRKTRNLCVSLPYNFSDDLFLRKVNSRPAARIRSIASPGAHDEFLDDELIFESFNI